MASDPGACFHRFDEDGRCEICGFCRHDLIINGVCAICGDENPQVSIKEPSDVVPASSLRRKKRRE